MTTRRGMTLMEVLLTATLVSVVGLTVFQAFNNGVKLWARSKGLDRDLGTAIFLERLGDDLRSTVIINGIPFKGIGSKIAFPAVVWTPADRNGARAAEGLVDQIGAVQYYYDYADKKIFRRQANYSQALKGKWGEPQEVASQVEDFLVRYYFAEGRGMLLKSIADEAIPAGAMVDLLYRDGTGERRLRRSFPIPVGG